MAYHNAITWILISSMRIQLALLKYPIRDCLGIPVFDEQMQALIMSPL